MKPMNDQAEAWLSDANLSESSVLVEIGAHSGYYSRSACKKYRVKHSYAIEPIQDNYTMLKRECQGTPVKPINIAISDVDGEVDFIVTKKSYSCGIKSIQEIDTFNFLKDKYLTVERVQSLTLKSFMVKYSIDNISLLLMNCEGAELVIFEELLNSSFLQSKIEMITVQLHQTVYGCRKAIVLLDRMNQIFTYKIILKKKVFGPSIIVFKRRKNHDKKISKHIAFFYPKLIYASLVDSLYPFYKSFKKQLKSLLTSN